MNDLTTVLQRKRAQLEKLQREVEVLSTAEALLRQEQESMEEPTDSAHKRPVQVSGAATPGARTDRVINQFP